MVMTLLKSEEREKQFAVVQNSADDDEKEDKESSVSGDVEDWEKTRAQLEGGTVKNFRRRGTAGEEQGRQRDH